MNNIDLNKITTEGRNKNTLNIDKLSTIDALYLMNNEDANVHLAVKNAIPQIAPLVDKIVESFEKGGRLIYMGAGTSGRIGLMDAVECYPTFSCSADMVQCLMAGGDAAMVRAAEGAEDDKEAAVNQLKEINFNKNDVLIGIAASGRTPYTIAGIEYANSLAATTGCITTSINSKLASVAQYPIEAITGAEVVMGSTRLKSGTAQKLICNMITTISMIKMGRVYSNLLIDMKATNEKVSKRCINVVKEALDISMEQAEELLSYYGKMKNAIFGYLTNIKDLSKVQEILDKYQGNIQKALKEYNK